VKLAVFDRGEIVFQRCVERLHPSMLGELLEGRRAAKAVVASTRGEAEVRRRASALVLGIERPEGPVTNPSAGERLRAGDVVWAVGDPQRMKPFFEAVRQE